ncbi:MAG TPA: Ig-like domain-containing protein [Vicinamibacterales bacterium]|nr:Ig-like domain-containing protein [Vicinamibacterales bacterium]
MKSRSRPQVYGSARKVIMALAMVALVPVLTQTATDVRTGLGGNEPTSAAVNPLSPNIIAVARGLSVAISTDFGVTFPTTVTATTNVPVYGTIASWSGCGDASVTFDSQGRLFFSYLLCGNDNAVPANRVDISAFVQQINATTGATVGNPIEVSGGALNFDDKEWIVADSNPSSPFRDNLYVIWTRLDGPSQVMFTRSTNGGATWSAPAAIDGGEGFVWPSHIAVAPNGDVYATYHSDTCGSATAPMFVLRDTTGGAQFQAAAGFQKTSFTAAVTCNVQSAAATAIPNTTFWMQGANQGFVIPDPVRTGQVYVVANHDPNDDFTSGDGGDIILARSSDDGLSWTVSTISHGPVGTLQAYPTGAIDQLGNLVVTWWDTRRGLTNAAGTLMLDQYATVSRDGGETFTFDFRVSDAAMDPDLNAPCRFGTLPTCGGADAGPNTLRIGEYNGTAAADGIGYAIWTGNNGTNPPSGGQTTYFDAFSILGAFADPMEPNDAWDPGVASVLGSFGSYNNQNLTIHSDTDEDFFKVVAHSTGKLAFRITYNGRLSDLDIQVRDKFNNAVATSSTGLDSNNLETLTIPAVAGEAYFLRVFAEPGQAPPINVYDLDILNTPAPTPFGLSLAAADDTGGNGLDNITNDPMPTITLAVDLNPLAPLAFSPDNGTASLADDPPGYKVEIYRNGTAVGRATPVAGQPGIFTFTFTTPLTEGLNFITARVVVVDNSDAIGGGTVHAVGQGGESFALLVTLDTTAPGPGALGPLDLLASSDSGGIDDDDITTFSTPSFSIGVNAPGLVRVYAQKLPAGANVQVAQFVVVSPNVWQFTVPSLSDGVYNLTATLEDGAGNVGPPTAPLKVTIAQFSLTLPGETTNAAAGPVVMDLAARTIQGFASVSATGVIGISGIPVVNVNGNGQTLTVNLTAGSDTLGYTPSGPAAGSFTLEGSGQTVNFSNAGVFTVNPLTGDDTVTTIGSAADDSVAVTVTTMLSVQVGLSRALNMPAADIEKVGIATLQGNDTIGVNIFDTVDARLFVDGGEPTTVNKGNDTLNLFDMSVGRKGVYSNISGGSTAGAGAVALSFKATGKSTRVDYVAIEKQTRR